MDEMVLKDPSFLHLFGLSKVKMMFSEVPQGTVCQYGKYEVPWEPKTFISRGYNPYIGGVKPSFFMVLGSKGT